jgi:hypothetical protein
VNKVKTLSEKYENIYKANYADLPDAGNYTSWFYTVSQMAGNKQSESHMSFFGGIEELLIYHVSLPILIPS